MEGKKSFEEITKPGYGIGGKDHITLLLLNYKVYLEECKNSDKDKLKDYLLELFHEDYKNNLQVFSYLKSKLK